MSKKQTVPTAVEELDAPFTMVSTTPTNATKSGTISIKPYFDPQITNLGLEKYGQSLFDGIWHEEPIALIERNGIKRYITGLNEFAPEVKAIQDPDQKKAKIRDIRKTVAQLERELAANYLDEEDEKFWDKVILLKPNNDQFWEKINVRASNQTVFLDPAKDPFDLIKIYAIEAGGIVMVAPSYEAARTMSQAPKFYLDKYVDTVSTKTEVMKIRNKALSELTTMFDKNQNKLFYVAKVLDGNSTQYKKSTPNDLTYQNMNNYIVGDGVEKNIKRAAQSFLDICALDMETLKIRSIIKDSTFYKFIAPKSDGFIWHLGKQTMMGRNVSDCLEFLKNPLHEEILMDLTKKVESYWNK